MTVAVPAGSLVNVLGVVYVYKKTSDGGDIYLTKFGLPYADLLELDNWYEEEWFSEHRERLEGTSAVFRVPTKEANGRSLELVVKNCRVGEHVPLETRTLLEFINTEFNSPWEEFALVMEMRDSRYGLPDLQIRTQLPLAIYVPPEKMQMWQSGRSQEKINRIVARHPGLDLDILRQYKMIYGWIHGRSAVQALRAWGTDEKDLPQALAPLTAQAIQDMDSKGYAVADMKPEHIIIEEAPLIDLDTAERSVRPAMLRRLVSEHQYSIIDYELLVRTPAHEKEVSYHRRHSYLDDQRDRWVPTELPEHLNAVEVLGVPYIFGHAESTGGKLWVVGRNSRLFDYFLPERWRKTHSWRLTPDHEVYYTFTKDHVHVVWKASRVGETPPEAGPDSASARRRNKIAEYGYNSPFEAFSIAHELSSKGVPTIYVRAIYMTGSAKVEPSVDKRRYESHRGLADPDGDPILREDKNYITIRGYYNGPDKWVAEQPGLLCRPIDLKSAQHKNLITPGEFRKLYDRALGKLADAGYDGSLLQADDLLLVYLPDGSILKDAEGRAEVRITNFELLHKI